MIQIGNVGLVAYLIRMKRSGAQPHSEYVRVILTNKAIRQAHGR